MLRAMKPAVIDAFGQPPAGGDACDFERPLTGREFPWHALDGEEVLSRLESHRGGLMGDQVQHRRERFGANLLPSRKVPGWTALFIRQFINPLIALLLGAAAWRAGMPESAASTTRSRRFWL